MEGTNVTSNSRPARTASRYYYGPHTHHFSGPVRRWEKKWVHVAPSQPSTTTKPKQSNVPKSSSFNSPILLRKWTPLSRPSPAADVSSGHVSRRKLRYTPIAVLEEKKKLAEKRVADNNNSQESQHFEKTQAMDSDDIYGMLDINKDLMGAHQDHQVIDDGHMISQYSRRSQPNHRPHPENLNKIGQLSGLWTTNE